MLRLLLFSPSVLGPSDSHFPSRAHGESGVTHPHFQHKHPLYPRNRTPPLLRHASGIVRNALPDPHTDSTFSRADENLFWTRSSPHPAHPYPGVCPKDVSPPASVLSFSLHRHFPPAAEAESAPLHC